MNYLKSITFLFFALVLFASCEEQNSVESDDTQEAESVDISAEKEAVSAVLKSYKDAIQNLTTEGTMELFTKEATIFESGGVEGTYENYVAHHLGPELVEFDSFIFSDYKIAVDIDLPFAFTTETYIFTINVKANEEKEREARVIKKKGVATAVLKKIDGTWKITKIHSSSRNAGKSSH